LCLTRWNGSVLFKKRTKNIGPAGLQPVEPIVFNSLMVLFFLKKEPLALRDLNCVELVGMVLFFIKEPKVLALRDLNSLEWLLLETMSNTTSVAKLILSSRQYIDGLIEAGLVATICKAEQ
jgi:hypothetical protein